MSAKVYYDKDANLDILKPKTIAVHRLREPGTRPGPEPQGQRLQGDRGEVPGTHQLRAG